MSVTRSGEVLRAALISTDSSFRDQVRELLFDGSLGMSLRLEVSERFVAFAEEQVKLLRQVGPDILVVDLEDDVELGIKFTQFLYGSNPAHRVVAVGPPLSPDLLLTAMRAGVADYLTKPITSNALQDTLLRVTQTLDASAVKPRRAGQLFTCFSPKGGSGVTSVATNLAIVLHRLTNKRTLLVDLDLELGEVALLLGVQPRFNFVDMVHNFHRMDAGLLASYIEQHPSGVHLLSAPFHAERSELVSGEEIRRILHFLRQHYDYVVVDTPKSFSPGTIAAFDQSDLVLLVTNVDLPSLRNIQRGLPMLRRVLPKGEEQIRLVVNRYHQADDIPLKQIEQTLGLPTFATICNDYEAVSGAINSGKPLVLNGNPRCARDIRALAGRLTGMAGDGGKNGSRTGLVTKLLGKIRRDTQEGTV